MENLVISSCRSQAIYLASPIANEKFNSINDESFSADSKGPASQGTAVYKCRFDT